MGEHSYFLLVSACPSITGLGGGNHLFSCFLEEGFKWSLTLFHHVFGIKGQPDDIMQFMMVWMMIISLANMVRKWRRKLCFAKSLFGWSVPTTYVPFPERKVKVREVGTPKEEILDKIFGRILWFVSIFIMERLTNSFIFTMIRLTNFLTVSSYLLFVCVSFWCCYWVDKSDLFANLFVEDKDSSLLPFYLEAINFQTSMRGSMLSQFQLTFFLQNWLMRLGQVLILCPRKRSMSLPTLQFHLSKMSEFGKEYKKLVVNNFTSNPSISTNEAFQLGWRIYSESLDLFLDDLPTRRFPCFVMIAHAIASRLM